MFVGAVALCMSSLTASGNVRSEGEMRRLIVSEDSLLESVFLNIPQSRRLDMLDYYDAGMKDFVGALNLFSDVRLDTVSDRHARILTELPTAYDLYLVTPTASDTLVVTVYNVSLGAQDSEVRVTDIRHPEAMLRIEPEYSDWLVDDALKRYSENGLLAVIPFVTATASVDTAGGDIILTNTSIAVPGLDEDIAACFKPSLRYTFKKGRYVKSR